MPRLINCLEPIEVDRAVVLSPARFAASQLLNDWIAGEELGVDQLLSVVPAKAVFCHLACSVTT
ncbi:hypothetical protein D3C86_1757320 [compost metagenome]